MWLQEPWVSWKSWLVDLSTVSHALGSSVLVPEKQTLYDLPSLGPHSRPRCPAPDSPEGLAGLVWTLSPSAAITGQRPDRWEMGPHSSSHPVGPFDKIHPRSVYVCVSVCTHLLLLLEYPSLIFVDPTSNNSNNTRLGNLYRLAVLSHVELFAPP